MSFEERPPSVNWVPRRGFEPQRVEWGHRYKRFGDKWHFVANKDQAQAEEDIQTLLSAPGGQQAEAYVVYRTTGEWTEVGSAGQLRGLYGLRDQIAHLTRERDEARTVLKAAREDDDWDPGAMVMLYDQAVDRGNRLAEVARLLYDFYAAYRDSGGVEPRAEDVAHGYVELIDAESSFAREMPFARVLERDAEIQDLLAEFEGGSHD